MLIDSHCHLDFPQFEADRDGVVERAVAAGVGGMITICTRVRQFERVRSVAGASPRIACSVGTHPHNAAEEADVPAEQIEAEAVDTNVVAIGEAGLDYHYENAPRDVQADVFRKHVAISRRTGLPLVIHSRDADGDMIDILRDETAKGAFPFVLHCFSSGPDLARVGVQLGGYVSFSGILTFKRSDELRAIARELPLERILVETDAPYLAPVPHRGQTNEPAYTAYTAQVLATERRVELGHLAEATRANTLRLFSRLPANFGLPA